MTQNSNAIKLILAIIPCFIPSNMRAAEDLPKKVAADSLINGKMIHIEGGDFTLNIYPIKCSSCGMEWNIKKKNNQQLFIDIRSSTVIMIIC